MIRKMLSLVRWSIGLALVAVVAGAVSVRAVLVGSLARESGVARVEGLGGGVRVERDARGVAVITAESGSLEDALAAQGFVHAQERFFQMDLLRRRAAGELAALVGPAALDQDRAVRVYRFREVARGVVERMPAETLGWLEAYARGVNAGLADLGVRPPEYVVLRRRPAAWSAEDCVLAALAMHESLSLAKEFEGQFDRVAGTRGEAFAEFVFPETTRFDAPMVGAGGDPDGPGAVPGEPEVRGGGGAGGEAGGEAGAVVRGPAPGSNNWAVSGARTRDGRAILANDMHLRIMTPPPWFRVQLNWGKGRFAAGVSLPGCPGVIAGSNGRVAWGFTNLTGDCEDFIRVRTDAEGRRYRFGPGAEDYEAFGSIVERIEVAGGPAEELVLRTTRWGVVTGKSWDGAPLVLRWPALDPETVNLRILGIIGAQTLEEAVECARGWWGPPQNCVMADATGRVAWVVTGWIPERRGFDGRRHADWSAEGVGWAGPVDEAKRPVVLDPADGVVFTANARPTGLEAARVLGRCWSMGDRAGRIAEVLRGGAGLTERDMLALQLDTRTPAMDFYRDVLLGAVGESETDAELAAARRAAAEWNGRADAESVGFRVLARFRGVLTERLERAVLGGAGGDGGANYWWLQDDEMFMRVLEERPAWVLARMRESSWEGAIRGTLRRSLGRASNEAERYPADWTWGRSNRVRFQHPLSLAVPWLGRVLDMPAEEQAGHVMAVRVAGPTFGASERLVVSPGREEDGILHMPGGQSGHFLSRHYRDGQGAWLRGEATALLAGPVVSGFRLEPAGARGRGPGG